MTTSLTNDTTSQSAPQHWTRDTEQTILRSTSVLLEQIIDLSKFVASSAEECRKFPRKDATHFDRSAPQNANAFGMRLITLALAITKRRDGSSPEEDLLRKQ